MTRPKRRRRQSPPPAEANVKQPDGISPAERQDLPEESAITGIVPFTSPQGHHYRIILSNETDVYEKPLPPPAGKSRK